MVNVAVLGGSGQVGRTIVEVLLNDLNHRVWVISRKSSTIDGSNPPQLICNYEDFESLKKLLESNEIHTVISCLGVHDEIISKAQIAAIHAAEKSITTRRFIPSNWSIPNDPKLAHINPWAKFQLQALEELRKTSLEWTEILPGYFLDFWGLPDLTSHMKPMLPAIDVFNKVAAIPGSGNDPVAFSYSLDVARIVARVLELPSWGERTYIIADKLTWNEFLALAEEARGVKFHVQYDSVERLRNGKVTELPNHQAIYPFFPKESLQHLYANLELLMTERLFDLPVDKSLSHHFPEIKMMTVRQMLETTWKQ